MQRILIQLDTDALPSVFDRVVAVDAGVDHLFSYGGVSPDVVTGLVHGAIFTRKPADLKHTAIFVGGSDVTQGDAVYTRAMKTCFGPMSVSVMVDSNGSNTTAAAAVLAAIKHVDPNGAVATVLGGTGPVGCRAAQLLAGLGATVRVVSRSIEKANTTCQMLAALVPADRLKPFAASSPAEALAACHGAHIVIAAGAAGAKFCSVDELNAIESVRVVIDVNAVPPLGIDGIGVMDKGVSHGRIVGYGAIGVGGTKMKIHAAAIRRLFESNDARLDTQAIFELGRSLT